MKDAEKGMEIGIEKGKEENKIEIVKASLLENIKIETISLITGLSIKKIKNEL